MSIIDLSLPLLHRRTEPSSPSLPGGPLAIPVPDAEELGQPIDTLTRRHDTGEGQGSPRAEIVRRSGRHR